VRPFGALVFGRLGDMIGRKYTFLVTILIMGLSTFIVGILPNYATIGVPRPVILIALRMLQGLALGGEYGGAATYVAEHAPMGKRGAYTSWIQTTATLGLFLSLMVILGTRTGSAKPPLPTGAGAFRSSCRSCCWPSGLDPPEHERVARLQEDEGRRQDLQGAAVRILRPVEKPEDRDLALFGLTAGQAVVWYSGQFYALFFLTQALKVDGATANIMVADLADHRHAVLHRVRHLSDKIGRKPIIMAGCLLAVVTYFPLFKALTKAANPDLAAAQAKNKVT
jgi:MFS family permease